VQIPTSDVLLTPIHLCVLPIIMTSSKSKNNHLGEGVQIPHSETRLITLEDLSKKGDTPNNVSLTKFFLSQCSDEGFAYQSFFKSNSQLVFFYQLPFKSALFLIKAFSDGRFCFFFLLLSLPPDISFICSTKFEN